MSEPLHILSAGIASPVGFTLSANSVAFRAGINAFTRPPYFRNKRSGEAIAVSALDSLNETAAVERIGRLAQMAAQEALLPFTQQKTLRLGVMFAAGENRPGLESKEARLACWAIIEGLPLAVQKHCCYVQTAGSAGTMLLLKTAQDHIQCGDIDLCLVGGSDSHVQIESLHWLEDSGRLKSSEHPNGVIPGEAAAFVVVASQDFASRLQLRSLAEISGVATAMEPKPWFQRQATHGQGLTQSVRQTFESAAAQVDGVFAEINGEPWRADEWGYAYLRIAKRLKSPLRVFHPSSSLGETGAASTPVSIALASAGMNRPNQTDHALLVWAASGTSGLRGSCVLRKVENS